MATPSNPDPIHNLNRGTFSKVEDPERLRRALARFLEPAFLTNLEDVEAALLSLSAADAELFALRVRGASYRVIANLTGTSEPAVRQRCARVQQLVQSAIQEHRSAGNDAGRRGKPGNDQPCIQPETRLEFYLDPGDASVLEVRAVLQALNELHHSSGGLGFEFRVEDTFVQAKQEVPA